MSQDIELHRADPGLRRLALWLPAGVILVAALALWWLQGWLGRLDTGAAHTEALLYAFLGLAIVLSTGGLLLGWQLWTEASRILVEDRYPASDMRTVRDVPVRHGDAARQMATRMRIGAAMAALLGIAVLGWSLAGARMLG